MKFLVHPLASGDTRPAAGAVDTRLIRRLQESFALLTQRQEELATRFYGRLFAAYPALRRLFPEDMAQQKRKLIGMLAWVLDHLHDPVAVRQAVADLGRRHVGYGVADEHYTLLIDILVPCMAEAASGQWDAETEADWRTALELLSDIMIRAAHEEKRS